MGQIAAAWKGTVKATIVLITTLTRRRKTKTPQSLDSAGFRRHKMAETEGFEPSIQVLAQMLP